MRPASKMRRISRSVAAIYILTAAVLILAGIVWYQHERISQLETALSRNTSHEAGSPLARITNLEYIINAHTRQIKETQQDIYRLQIDQADLDWRIRRLHWDTENKQ